MVMVDLAFPEIIVPLVGMQKVRQKWIGILTWLDITHIEPLLPIATDEYNKAHAKIMVDKLMAQNLEKV